MERREAVKYISILLGGAVVGADAFLTGCKPQKKVRTDFTEEDVAYLNEIGETILPQTATPGAKAANVGAFMTVMVNDCYEEGDQRAFKDGMDKLNDVSNNKFKGDFMKITPEQRHELLVELDKEAKEYQKEVNKFNSDESQKEREETRKGNLKYKKQYKSSHYFTMMKQLTLLGFFTSEVGMTKALNYKPVPGRFDGCIPYKKGDKMLV